MSRAMINCKRQVLYLHLRKQDSILSDNLNNLHHCIDTDLLTKSQVGLNSRHVGNSNSTKLECAWYSQYVSDMLKVSKTKMADYHILYFLFLSYNYRLIADTCRSINRVIQSGYFYPLGPLFRQIKQFSRCFYATNTEILCWLLIDNDNQETDEF